LICLLDAVAQLLCGTWAADLCTSGEQASEPTRARCARAPCAASMFDRRAHILAPLASSSAT